MAERMALIANGNVRSMTTSLGKMGDYQLITLLGSGGMGEVFFGVSPTADPVAVKVIKPQLVSGGDMRERFASEVENLKTVYGSRVARLEEADPYGDPPWLAVAYIPGLTLKQYVELHGKLPLDLASMVGAMLAEGLRKVHQGGVLHRDLKPQNIILGPSGPVLIDFGLAVLTEREDELTQTGVLVGTPAYMAPEQAKGEKNVSAAADVYGLGATLVFALTGHTLYPSANGYALLKQLADPNDLPDMTGVPVELAPLIGAMLAFDPAARPNLGAVRTRLLEVATSGGESAEQMWNKVAEVTYDPTTKVEVPPPLVDPVEDPEGDEGRDEHPSIIEPHEPPEPDDKLPPAQAPPADLSWLVDKLRRQYARRPNL